MSKAKLPSNQELRTRKDILLAAARLIREGRRPNMDDIAKEALVSRATVYRHFKNVEALLAEAPVDAALREPEEILAEGSPDDPLERIARVEAAMHEVTWRNEAALRVMLASSIGRDPADDSLPKRQNRRTPLIEAALAPARERFTDEAYEKLVAALALIFGTESMIVFKDVIRIDEDTAREVKIWAAKALVQAALGSS